MNKFTVLNRIQLIVFLRTLTIIMLTLQEKNYLETNF